MWTGFAAGRDCQKGDKNERLVWVGGDCFHRFALAFDSVSPAKHGFRFVAAMDLFALIVDVSERVNGAEYARTA